MKSERLTRQTKKEGTDEMTENVNVISRNDKGNKAMVIVTNDQYPKGKTMHLVLSKEGWTDSKGRTGYKV